MILPYVPQEFLLPFICALPFVVMAAWTDFSRMEIPNRLVIVSGIFVLVVTFACLPLHEATARVLTGGIAFGICSVMFAARLLGGGDTKFFPVMILALPGTWLGHYLFLFGLSLAATMLLLQVGRTALAQPDARMLALRPGRDVPMGVAFAMSYIALAVFALASAS